MKLRTTPEGLIAEDSERGRWVSLHGEVDLLSFLAGGKEAVTRARAAIARAPEADPSRAVLPFRPRSIRAFMLWEQHVIDSSRMLVKKFFPAPAAKVVLGYERLTGKTVPEAQAQRPLPRGADLLHREPHIRTRRRRGHVVAVAHEVPRLRARARLRAREPLVDATPEEAIDAVGGWFVLNDWSARDVQADDARRNIFGPVVKSKTFANSIGFDVVTADAVPDWTAMRGRVRVDGELWCEGTTANPQHTLGAMLAYASAGEKLDAGDVISTGTMPGCCGLELDRWIQPGQTVELEIDGIGTLTNRISPTAVPV
jgi:hypothetical protein